MLRYLIEPSVNKPSKFMGYVFKTSPFELTAVTEELDTIEEVKKVCRLHFKEARKNIQTDFEKKRNFRTYFIITEPVINE